MNPTTAQFESEQRDERRSYALRGDAPIGLLALVMVVLGVAYPIQLHNFDAVGVDGSEFDRRIEQLEDSHDTEGDIAIGGGRKKFAFGMIALTAIGLVARALRLGRIRIGDLGLILAAYLLWAGFSFAWSVTPSNTLRELVRLYVTAMLAIGLVANFSLRDCVRVLLAATAGTVVAAFVLEIGLGAFHPWDGAHRFAGGVHPNLIALHGALLATAAAALLTQDKASRWGWVWLGLAFLAMFLTKSRSSLMCGMLGVSVVATAAYGLRRTILIWCLMLTAGAGGALVLGVSPPATVAKFTGAATLGREDKVGTLSGRVPLWFFLAEEIKNRPIEGHGYKAYWTSEKRLQIGDRIGWYPPEAHSAYMDVFVQLGVVGLSLYLAMGLLLGWRLVTYRPANNAERAGVAFLMGLFVIAIVHGLTESTVSEARIAGLAMGVAVLAMAKPVFATAGALRGAGGQSRARAFESPSTTPNPPYAY